MTKEEFESIKEFAGRLAELRHQIADGQLLDRCQEALNDLIGHASLNFEEYPQDEVAAPEEDLPSGMFEPVQVREPEPPPPPPQPEFRQHATQHKVEHKRPTSRKTRR